MPEAKYLVFYYGSKNEKNFIYEINHSSIYHTEKYVDALFIDTKEHAFAIAEYCHNRCTNYDYKVLEIKTTMDVVEEE